MATEIGRIYRGNLYIDEEGHAGAFEEATLPPVAWLQADLKSAAMVGKLKRPNGLDEMPLALKGAFNPRIMRKAANPNRSVNIQVRCNYVLENAEGIKEELPLVAKLRGRFKDTKLGAIKSNDQASEADYVFMADAYSLQLGDELLFDIDIWIHKVIVGGEDVFAVSNANLGLI